VLLCLAVLFTGADRPKGLRELFEEGGKHLSQRNAEAALASFSAAAEINPNMPQIYNAMGIAHLQMNAVEEAAGDFGRAVEIDPNYAEGYFNLGLSLQRMGGQNDKVRAYYEKTVELDPGFGKAHASLGWMYMEDLNDPARAIKSLKAAVDLNPNDIRSQYGLGMSAIASGKNHLALGPISELRRLNQQELAMNLESKVSGASSEEDLGYGDTESYL